MIELLTIYQAASSGSGYSPMLVDGEALELCEYSYVGTRMGSSSISGTLRHVHCLDTYWTGREFVIFRGERYYVMHTPSSSKSNEDARYVHTLEFRSGHDALLSGVYFCDAVDPGASSAEHPKTNSYEVRFYGTLDDFVERFNDVLSHRGLSDRFSVSLESGVMGVTEVKEISFDKVTLAEALTKAYEVWEVPYYFVGGGCIFGLADSVEPIGVEYGGDRELLSVSMTNRSEKIVTRVMGCGGSENVPYYYPNPTPKGWLGVGGTASGVSIVDPLLFAKAVGVADTLEYMGDAPQTSEMSLTFKSGEPTVSVGSSVGEDGVVYAETGGGDPLEDRRNGGAGAIRKKSFVAGATCNLSGFEGLLSFRLDLGAECPGHASLYYRDRGYSGSGAQYRLYSSDAVCARGFEVEVLRVLVEVPSLSRIVSVPFSANTVPVELEDGEGAFFSAEHVSGITLDMGAIARDYFGGNTYNGIFIRIYGNAFSTVPWYYDTPGAGMDSLKADAFRLSLTVTSSASLYGWCIGDLPIGDLSEVGLSMSGSPSVGATITQTVLRYIEPTGRIMPSIYLDTDGLLRGFDATNDPVSYYPSRPDHYVYAYTDEERQELYEFEHEYDAREPHEYVEDFDDIHPSIKNLKDGSGNPLNVLDALWFDPGYNTHDTQSDGETLRYQYFFVKLKPLGFNLFASAIENGEMALVMSDGPCAGCHFKILVDEDGSNPVQAENGELVKVDGWGEIDPGNIQAEQQDTTSVGVWIALAPDSSTFGGPEVAEGILPSARVHPGIGDSYVIENILLPYAYFTAAERELDRALVKFMWENNYDKLSPVVTFSRVFLAHNPDVLAALSERSILSLTYDGRIFSPLYVSQFTYNVKEGEPLPEILVETTDVIERRTSGLDEKISDALKGVIPGGGGGGMTESVADRRYIRKDADDVADGRITFMRGAQFGERYQSGMGGVGGTIYTDSQGQAIAEFDFLNVRKKATFSEIEVDQLRKISGRVLISLADLVVSVVERLDDGWKCYFDAETGDGRVVGNGFVVGDQAICQKWTGEGTHYYWRLVTEVGDDYIVLSDDDRDKAPGEDTDPTMVPRSGAPEVGDTIVQLGNRTDPSRQSAQVLSCYGENTPSYVMYAGVNSYNLTGKDVFSVIYKRTDYDNTITDGDGNVYRYWNDVEPGEFMCAWKYLSGPGGYDIVYTEEEEPGEGVDLYGEDGDPAELTPIGVVESLGTNPYYEPYLSNYGSMLLGDRYKARDYIEYDHQTGTFNIKANVVFKPGQSIPGFDYLKETFPLLSTTISGGVVLTSSIALRDANAMITAGINGVTSPSALGGGLAAWYGGPAADKEATPQPRVYAKTVFRFDGSGYLAGGKISWNAAGVMRFGEGILIGDSGVETLASLVTAMSKFNSWFEEDENGDLHVRKKTVGGSEVGRGLWTEGFLTAGGINSGSGGGGGGNAAWVPNSSLWPTESAQAIGLNVDDTIHTLSLRGHRHNITDIDGVLNLPLEYRDNLPAASASTMGKIYLVPSSQQETRNIKDEYITIQSGSSYVWEQIGNTAVDLTNYVQKSNTTGLLKNDGTVDTNSYVTIGTTQTITGQKTFNLSPLPGGTITGNYSNIALGSNTARWRSLYGVELVLGSNSSSALGTISLTYNRESDNVAYTSQIFGYSRSRNAIYFGGVDFSDKGGNFEIYANSSISFRIKRSDSTTHDVVMDVQRGKVVTTNLVASGYIQTPVIKNSSGIDRISISSNVTISTNTIIGGNLYPDAANRTLGITGNPWKNIYIADNGGLYFGAFGGSTTVPFIVIDNDLNFGTVFTTRSDQTPKRHRIYGSSIQGIVQSKLGTGTYVIFDAKYNSNAAIYEIAPTVDGDVNLGSYTYRWNRLYAKTWYPTTSSSADAPHIEYVAAVGSTPGYFKIVGNVMTTGYHTVGGINPNTGDTSINGNLIPSTDATYSLGSSGMRFKDAYFSGSIGSAGAPVNEIYVTTIGEDASPGRVTNIYAENIKSANTLTINKLATTTIAFTMPGSSGGSASIAALTSALANIRSGQVYTLVDSTNKYNLRITGWRQISSSQHEIYTGAFKFVQNSSTPNNWTVTKL